MQLRDYNFKQPNANMKGEANGTEKYTKAQMELYDYPGKYDKQEDGRDYAEISRREQALDHRRFAAGDAVSFCPGGLFTLEEHPVDAGNQQYLIARCVHRFSTDLYRSSQGVAAIGDHPYHGNYEFLPGDRTFRAPIVTPKPVVYGPHTAKVVARSGKDGEEIDVDDDGQRRNRGSFSLGSRRQAFVLGACRANVGGRQMGRPFHSPHRHGSRHRVLEGNPGQAACHGSCLYNGDNKFPYSLPDNKT